MTSGVQLHSLGGSFGDGDRRLDPDHFSALSDWVDAQFESLRRSVAQQFRWARYERERHAAGPRKP